MAKQNKKHRPVSDQVLEAVQAKQEVPSTVVDMFASATKALEIVAAKHAAEEAQEATGSDNEVPASPVEETTETPTAPIQGPANDDDLQLTLAGTTDDVRAPLAVPTVTPKPPRKPFVNWGAVWSNVMKGATVTALQTGEFIWSLLIALRELSLIILASLLALWSLMFYGLGWAIRVTWRAFHRGLTGYNIFKPQATA